MSANSENMREYYEDEIDLIEIFKKIWKWKWFVILFTAAVTLLTFLYVSTRPDTYTSEAVIKIGKIANVYLEGASQVELYISSNARGIYYECMQNIEINQKRKVPLEKERKKKLPVLYLSGTSDSPELAYNCANEALDMLIKRHNELFKKGIEEMRNNIDFTKSKEIITPQHILESYNYPTRIIEKPFLPEKPDSKKIVLKTIVAFLSSMMMSVFLIFFIDYILGIRKEE